MPKLGSVIALATGEASGVHVVPLNETSPE